MNYNFKNTNWKKIRNGAKKYLMIMRLVNASNVQTNRDFQRAFNGFYKIRQRPKSFYRALYGYLEKNKNKEISFEQALSFFYRKFNRFEPSFSSKVVATINPNLPVWDSVVIKKLKLEVPKNNLNKAVRLKKMVLVYDDLIRWYIDFLKTNEARRVIKSFDRKVNAPNITDIKKADLILWQTRS